MSAKDILPQNICLELFRLDIESREPAIGMGNKDPAIRRTLHRAKHTRASGRPLKTDIKHGLEWTTVILVGPGDLVFAVGFNDTLERVRETELGERAAGEEETGSVGSSPVGETVLDAVAGELVGVGRGEDHVAGDFGRDDLRDNLPESYQQGLIGEDSMGGGAYITVGEPHNEPVLGGIVLVLRLGDQPLTSIVVCLALTSATVLCLVARVVGFGLDDLGERLQFTHKKKFPLISGYWKSPAGRKEATNHGDFAGRWGGLMGIFFLGGVGELEILLPLPSVPPSVVRMRELWVCGGCAP